MSSNISKLTARQESEVRYLGYELMTPSEWAEIEGNPRQRNTEKHAKSAEHLNTPHPTHAFVNMAILPNGQKLKLDGHTRSFMWQNGQVAPPKELTVHVWACPSVEDAKSLYKTFDNRAAVETVNDEVFGTLRDLKVSFKSDVLKGTRFVASMRYAYEMLFPGHPAKDIESDALVKFWLRELKEIDEINPSRKMFPTPIMMAALLTFRKYGHRAEEFWLKYSTQAGIKLGGSMDAVQGLHERLMQRKADQSLSGRENATDVAAHALAAFEKYQKGGRYKAGAGGVKRLDGQNLREWLNEARVPLV